MLDISITNTSDAHFELKNLSKMTFMDHADRIVVAPNMTSEFSVKTGKKRESVRLKFEVQNALLKPRKHPKITLTAKL